MRISDWSSDVCSSDLLATRAGEVLSRETLSEQGRIGGNVRTVDVQVTRLRRKSEEDPRLPRYLQTVRGEGYVLWADENGRASCRARVCQYVSSSGLAESITKNKQAIT